MTRNIAIVGKMYAGKTTLANELVKAHGFERVMMAGPLKDLARRAYGEEIQKDKMYDVMVQGDGSYIADESRQRSGREILQGIGQSIKVVDRDIWLKIFDHDTSSRSGRFVVDDVRFKFEADFLRNKGWYVVRVWTPLETRKARAFDLTHKYPTTSELSHESEVEVDNIQAHYVHEGDTPLESLPFITKNIVSLASY